MSIISTEKLSRADIVSYSADPIFSVIKFTPSAAFAADFPAGAVVNAAGQLLKSTDTVAYILADGVKKNQTTAVVLDKFIVVREASLSAFDASGLTKAKELVSASGFIRLV